MIRVALVEDQAALRRSLAVLLDGTPGFGCAGAYPDCESLLAEVRRLELDLLLLDLRLPGLSGVEGVRRVHQIRPQLPVMIFTAYEDDDLVLDALCAGACSYLLKRTPPAYLLEAIRDAVAGGSPMSSQIARKVVRLLRQGHAAGERPESPPLTARERDVLRGLAEGGTYQTVARELGISADTVRFHVRNLYAKLAVHSQGAAVAKALRHGLL
jgi:DNA-binding NarL/FixJ family response regulator